MTSVAGAGAAGPGARVRRILCATVLVAEALVVGFALLVAKDLTTVSTAVLAGLGGGTAAACVLLAGSLRRSWAYAAGSLLQVLIVLAGLIVPAMFFLGGVFALLWFLSLYLSAHVDRVAAQRLPGAGPRS